MERRTFLATVAWTDALAAGAYAQSSPADEESIRMLVKTFANARNAHDGPAAAALYSQDGEWIGARGASVRGRIELARMWSGVTGQVQRAIQSIDFAGPNIAVVRVLTQYEQPISLHHETFIFVKDTGTWNIRVHQSVD